MEDEKVVRIRLNESELRRPRQWGACWLAGQLYQKLELAGFWRQRLPASRKGTRWDQVLQTLVSYRLIDPGSEWRLHREWFDKSAMADLLGADYRLATDDTLYRCLDQLVKHKAALFSHLQQRWEDLFAAEFDVLLYDLTSTYFESDPPFPEGDKRRFGYSRDKRFDCVQVALVCGPVDPQTQGRPSRCGSGGLGVGRPDPIHPSQLVFPDEAPVLCPRQGRPAPRRAPCHRKAPKATPTAPAATVLIDSISIFSGANAVPPDRRNPR